MANRVHPLLWVGLGAAVLLLAAQKTAQKLGAAFPHGYPGVKKVYGDFAYTDLPGGRIAPDPAWRQKNITSVQLHTGKTVEMHQAVAANFRRTFEAAAKASGWTPSHVETYVPRHVNWDPQHPLSMHSWGIAVDFDPGENTRIRSKIGTVAIHPVFVDTFKREGWTWGGDWKGASFDPMHFQAASQ